MNNTEFVNKHSNVRRKRNSR